MVNVWRNPMSVLWRRGETGRRYVIEMIQRLKILPRNPLSPKLKKYFRLLFRIRAAATPAECSSNNTVNRIFSLQAWHYSLHSLLGLCAFVHCFSYSFLSLITSLIVSFLSHFHFTNTFFSLSILSFSLIFLYYFLTVLLYIYSFHFFPHILCHYKD